MYHVWGEDKGIQDSGGEASKKKLHDPDVKGRIILRCVLNRMEKRGIE